MIILDEMQGLNDKWVEHFSEGDIEACVEMHTENGAIYSPYGSAAVGRDAIRDIYGEWHEAGEQNKQIKVLEADCDGAIAYFTATYSGDYPQADGTLVNESGVVLTICTRAPNGSWKMQVSSLNSDTPPLAES